MLIYFLVYTAVTAAAASAAGLQCAAQQLRNCPIDRTDDVTAAAQRMSQTNSQSQYSAVW